MNKKRFFIFFTIVILAISMVTVLIVRNRHTVEPMVAIEESVEGVRFFYYRSIPGLKRAEEASLVVPIHKIYKIPEKPYELKIDRIWYSEKNIYVLYHVENIDKIAYLGGYFYLEDEKPDELPKFDPKESIGRPSEKGVFFNNGFYSCTIFPTLDDIDEDANNIYFEPFLQIEGTEYSFEPIILQREQWIKEEPEESFKLDASVQINDSILQFHELKAGISSNKIYFSYTSPNSEVIYGLQGSIQTDKGEQLEIYTMPHSIFENPEHYYIEVPPFDSIPNSLKFHLESMDVIGTDNIVGEIDTNLIKKAKNSKTLHQELGQIKNTTIEIERLIFNDDFVSIEITYNNATELEPPYSRLKIELPILEHQKLALLSTQNIYNPLPNVVSVKNNYYKSPGMGTSGNGLGTWVTRPDENKIFISIPKSFWDESDRIYIEINNLTYQNVLDESIQMDLFK